MQDEYETQGFWTTKQRIPEVKEMWIVDRTDYESLKLNGPIQIIQLSSAKSMKELPIQTISLTFKA